MKRLSRWLVAVLFVVGLAFAHTGPARACEECEAECCATFNAGVFADLSSELGQWATKFEKWLKDIAFLGNIIQIVMFVANTLTDFMEEFTTKLDILIAVEHVDNTLKAQLAKFQHQEKITTQVESKKSALEAKIAQENQPTDGDAVLCNTINARQGMAPMIEFAEICTQEVSEALMSASRGAGVDATGPQAAAIERLLRCPPAWVDVFADYPGTMNELDGAPEECLQTGFADADINPKTFIDEDTELEMPYLTEYTMKGPDGEPKKDKDGKPIKITIPVPEKLYVPDEPTPANSNLANYYAQVRWLAAFHYCHIAAGPRPAPPADKGMITPDGLTASAKWDECATKQSAFIRQCAKMICKNTRPHGGDENTEDIREASMGACHAAVALDIPTKANCRYGLTLNQAERIAHMACYSGQRATFAGTGAGSAMHDILASGDRCTAILGQWRAQKAQEMGNFVKAMNNLHKLKGCWPDVNIRPTVRSSP